MAEHGQPVHLRQHDVEHDEVGPVVGQPGKRLRPGRGLVDADAVAFEVATDDLANDGLIVDDEHPRTGLHELRVGPPWSRVGGAPESFEKLKSSVPKLIDLSGTLAMWGSPPAATT